MNKLNIKQLKQTARQRLEQCQTPYRNTVVKHTAISGAAMLLVLLISLVTGHFMDQTSGLGDMALRSALETVDGVLSMALTVLRPFWAVGIVYTSILVCRQQPAGFSQLTRGFQRFGPVLRYQLLWIVICIGVGMAVSYVVSFAAMLLPGTGELMYHMAQLDPAVLTDPEAMLAALPMDTLMNAMLGMALLFLAVFFAVIVWLAYRFTMAQYLLVDQAPIGAMAALSESGRMTRGNKWQLFKLDMSFWWYYGLLLLANLVLYLPEVGMLLENERLQSFSQPALYVVYILFAVLLSWWAGAYVHTTYACAYEQLRQQQVKKANTACVQRENWVE